ncbi:MAG: hypothetical protein WBC97_10110 [Gemmatimonadales bacterium]
MSDNVPLPSMAARFAVPLDPVSSGRGPWVAPVIEPLPKLTELTLLSPIGGGGGIGGSTVFGLLLAVGLLFGVGACSDPLALNAPGSLPPHLSRLMTCTARRADLTLTCTGPEAASGTVTIGSQGVIVALRSSNVSYDTATDILQATVTVQNLSILPLNTPDGTTLGGGLDVFFVSGPSGPLGQVVDLPNEDGTGTYTAADQPYFRYGQILAPQAISSGKLWQFHLIGVASFTFSVLVSTTVPSSQAFLTWTEDPVVGRADWGAIGGWGNKGLALFGKHGVREIFDGTQWRSRADIPGNDISTTPTPAAAATGPSNLFALLSDGHTIRYWDGISWRTISDLSGGPNINHGPIANDGASILYSLTDSVRMFTVNPTVAGGGTWSTIPSPGGGLTVCTGGTVTHGMLVCAFGDNVMRSWDGSSWTSEGNTGVNLANLVFADDTSDIWAYSLGGGGALTHYTGGSWAAASGTPGPLSDYLFNGGTITATHELYLGGSEFTFVHGVIWHFDGANWTEEYNGTLSPIAFFARNADTVYATGQRSLLMKRTSGTWSTLAGDFGGGTGSPWQGLWVNGPDDIFVSGTGGAMRHWDGTQWVAQSTPDVSNGESIWGTSGTNVYLAGYSFAVEHYDGTSWTATPGYVNGLETIGIGGSGAGDIWTVGVDGSLGSNIAHFNGSSWSASASPADNVTLDAVWAGADTLAVAVGSSGRILRWDGSNWTQATSPTTAELLSVWGTSSTDIWAVGRGGTIIHWNGSSWGSGGSSCDGGNDVHSVWGRSPTEVYAATDGGQLCFYDGTSWVALPLEGVGSGDGALFRVGGDATGSIAVAVGQHVYRGTR